MKSRKKLLNVGTARHIFLILAAIAVRICLFGYETLDYKNFLSHWVEFFRQNGGFAALKLSVGNYNIPYLYFLALFSYIPVNDLYLIKGLSCVFDFVLAYAVYRLSKSRTAAYISLFLPTVVMNGALWGQCDSIYVSLALLAVAMALDDRPVLSMVLFACSFGFKLQAVFILPVAVILLMRGKYKWYHFLVFPLAYFILILPAVLMGRPLRDAFMLYADQMGTVGDAMNYNAPSLTAIIRNPDPNALILLAFAAMLALFLLYRGDVRVLTALMVCVIPFLLPHMHDRYFYACDVMALVLAASSLYLIPAAVLAECASLICYIAYLQTHYIRFGNSWITNKAGAWFIVFALVSWTVFLFSEGKISSLRTDEAPPHE